MGTPCGSPIHLCACGRDLVHLDPQKSLGKMQTRVFTRTAFPGGARCAPTRRKQLQENASKRAYYEVSWSGRTNAGESPFSIKKNCVASLLCGGVPDSTPGRRTWKVRSSGGESVVSTRVDQHPRGVERKKGFYGQKEERAGGPDDVLSRLYVVGQLYLYFRVELLATAVRTVLRGVSLERVNTLASNR